ncbi:replicative DNA helicase [Serratia sp. M24T3]|nr:replicative DNA helicase [Serratia sp. M24T3]
MQNETRLGGKVPAPVIARALNKPLNALIKKAGDMGISLTVPKSRLDKHWPVNSDLRDGGSIEQDADGIYMLYREGVYEPESPAAPYAEIIVTKNRFGSLGTVYQLFKNGHFMRTDQAIAAKICKESPQSSSSDRRYLKRDI